MIKSHLQDVVKQEEQVDEILCNCCGKPIKKNVLGIEHKFIELDDTLHVEQAWGYFSNHDGDIHRFDICQDCYDKSIKTFKIPIEIEEYNIEEYN